MSASGTMNVAMKHNTVYAVATKYSSSKISVCGLNAIFFAFLVGCATSVFGFRSSSSSRSGTVGGSMAYRIGVQKALKVISHAIGGQKACVARQISFSGVVGRVKMQRNVVKVTAVNTR